MFQKINHFTATNIKFYNNLLQPIFDKRLTSKLF